MAARSDGQIMEEREEMICMLELASHKMWESGLCDKWFQGADDTLKKVTKGVNGPLLAALLQASGHVDCNCTELLRRGVRLCAGCSFVLLCTVVRC